MVMPGEKIYLNLNRLHIYIHALSQLATSELVLALEIKESST